MNKIKIFLPVFLLVVVGMLTLSSCEKAEVTPSSGLEKSAEAEKIATIESYDNLTVADMPQVINRMLVFSTRKQAQNYMKLSMSEENKLKQIEKQIGFKSVQSLYFEILDSQEKLYAQYEKTIRAEDEFLEKINSGKIKKYTDFTEKYLANGFIKEEVVEIEGEKKIHLALTTSFPHYATILNLENQVMINDTIYQFNPGEMKMITDGDFSKIKQMENTTTTDLDECIIVANNKTKDYRERTYVNKNAIIGKSNGNKIGSKRIEGWFYFDVWEYQTSQGLWRYYSFSTTLTGSTKTLVGWWNWSNHLAHYSVDCKVNTTYLGWSDTKSKSFNGGRVTGGYVIIHESWQRASDFTKLEFEAEANDVTIWLDEAPAAEASITYSWLVSLID